MLLDRSFSLSLSLFIRRTLGRRTVGKVHEHQWDALLVRGDAHGREDQVDDARVAGLSGAGGGVGG